LLQRNVRLEKHTLAAAQRIIMSCLCWNRLLPCHTPSAGGPCEYRASSHRIKTTPQKNVYGSGIHVSGPSPGSTTGLTHADRHHPVLCRPLGCTVFSFFLCFFKRHGAK
jgi:hypothetical protein